jgi:hypothetical protein
LSRRALLLLAPFAPFAPYAPDPTGGAIFAERAFRTGEHTLAPTG